MNTPKNVKHVLKKLNKSYSEIGQECISEVEKSLRGNGYTDAKLWAKTALQALIGELGGVEDEFGLEQIAMQLDGFERDAVEAFYEIFTDLQDELHDVHPVDIRDTLVYSIMNALDKENQKKYKGLYN